MAAVMSMLSAPCGTWTPPPCPAPVPGAVLISATPPPCPGSGQLWWDGSILHLFDGVVWVSIGSAVGGVKGVVDGSIAFPGYVGEVITTVATGSLSVIPPPGAAAINVTALVVPPGDWDVWSTINIADVTPNCFWDYIIFIINNPAGAGGGGEVTGAWTGGGLTGGQYSCAPIPVSVSVPTIFTATLQIVGVTGGISGTGNYTLTTVGRRVR